MRRSRATLNCSAARYPIIGVELAFPRRRTATSVVVFGVGCCYYRDASPEAARRLGVRARPAAFPAVASTSQVCTQARAGDTSESSSVAAPASIVSAALARQRRITCI